MADTPHGPELPLQGRAQLLGSAKPRATPGQIKMVDNRDDRLEIATLIKHLSPARRVDFLRWACSQAFLPGSWIHPAVAPSTVKLAEQARSCDRANDALTMDVLMTLTHMGIDYALDLSKCLEHLVLMVRNKA